MIVNIIYKSDDNNHMTENVAFQYSQSVYEYHWAGRVRE